MYIRPTEKTDLKRIMEIYDFARAFMQENGNPNQWIDGYPSEEFMLQEITANHSFVCENEQGELVGTFCFIIGEDPTYRQIENGKWLNDNPYGTLHRIASNGRQKGLFHHCIEWCFKCCGNIRVDTHQDNVVMQSALTKDGFKECGIIYTTNGTPRIAYQKSL
ncbi:GNAT family N-acetyltransferase [Bacteroides reticulotermitis]|uniref:GNAT family N-acetyltransferase n=1 Tax=Bacteroides reticulotermitis TaxID=1133319 RepID=UPI003A8BBC9F